jgi:hypothetical protein
MVLTGRWELRDPKVSVSENGSAQRIVKPKDGVTSVMRRFNANMKAVANR